MKTAFLLLCIVAACSAMSQDIFDAWAKQHGKSYGATERAARFEIFKQNMAKAEALNRENPDAQFGATHFADLTPAEFKAQYLSDKHVSASSVCPLAPNASQPGPASYDWRDHGAVLPVKDQGGCGSCWSFSAVGNMEARWFLAGNTLTAFSEQQLVDCDQTCDPDNADNCDAGCNGGLMELADLYAINNGMMAGKDYKYTGNDDTCKYSASKVVAKFTSCVTVAADNDAVRDTLVEMGPLSIAVHADPWQLYFGGIFSSSCNNKESDLDHGVVLVGYGTEGSKDFWIIRNSWGSGWGEKGYIRVLRSSKNLCGVNDDVTSIIV